MLCGEDDTAGAGNTMWVDRSGVRLTELEAQVNYVRRFTVRSIPMTNQKMHGMDRIGYASTFLALFLRKSRTRIIPCRESQQDQR